MEYNDAKAITKNKQNCECIVSLKCSNLIDSASQYRGRFMEVTTDSFIIETQDGAKPLKLKLVENVRFD